MEENKIWRVQLRWGYNEVSFDFDDIDVASHFVMTASKAYNQDLTYEKKKLYINMRYVNKCEEEDD